MSDAYDVSSWPARCDGCGRTFTFGELLVRPVYVDDELTYFNLCRQCYQRSRGVIEMTVGPRPPTNKPV